MTAASRQYHAQAVLAASPAELIDKLYGVGIAAAHSGDAARVRRVLVELIGALNPEAEDDLVGRLQSLYEYALRETQSGDLEPALDILNGLRETWRAAFFAQAAAA